MEKDHLGNPLVTAAVAKGATDAYKSSSPQSQNIILLAGAAVLLGGVYLVSNTVKTMKQAAQSILEKIGLAPDAVDQYNKTKSLELEGNALNPNYWINTANKVFNATQSKISVWTAAQAQKYAKQINDAWGVVNDDESSVYAALRAQKSKCHLSRVAQEYSKLYNKDLADDMKYYLTSYFSEKELSAAYAIIDPLPIYQEYKP